MDENIKNDQNIIDTSNNLDDGQIKCPKCGSTDIQTNTKTGKLRCNFCRHEFEVDLAIKDMDLSNAEGSFVGSGAKDIDENADDIITLKCESCGAEVVIDTKSSNQARCHWCRNTLSINNQIPNGAVPDVLLPFSIRKEDAKLEIEKFVGERKFFAHPKFSREFTTENICGVYFPYMIVDVNAHMKLSGEGEIETGRRKVKTDDGEKTEYDADVYKVKREFDIFIDDLSIESSSDKLDYSSKEKTTNIINSIMPFDTENCVKYNANYMKGYTSEKRDTNIDLLKKITDLESSDVARYAIKDSLLDYNRGVKWEKEDFKVKADYWKAAYLPVWLYSYMENKGKKNIMHYVAVNARTKETMGSVPINFSKLFLVSALVEVVSFIIALILYMVAAFDIFDGTKFQDSREFFWLLLVGGFIFYFSMYNRYRNQDARHAFENETKSEISNLIREDNFIRSDKHLSNSRIRGENYAEIKANKSNLKKEIKKFEKEMKKSKEE